MDNRQGGTGQEAAAAGALLEDELLDEELSLLLLLEEPEPLDSDLASVFVSVFVSLLADSDAVVPARLSVR